MINNSSTGPSKRVLVILAQALESNTSAIIRCKSIIEGLAESNNSVVCYSLSPNEKSSYFDCFQMNKNIEIRRYGPQSAYQSPKEELEKSVGFTNNIKRILYRLYKKIDIFGVSIRYVKYKKAINEEIHDESYDILLSFSDPMPCHMIGNYLKKKSGIYYVQQWGDPLTTDLIGKTALPRWIRKIIEVNLIKKADKICYVSPFTLNEQKRVFKKYSNKMVFLPTPCLHFEPPQKCDNVKNRRLKLGYFGSYGSIARNIYPLYSAVKECDFCELLIVGNSDLRLEKADNIYIVDRAKQKEIMAYIDEVDVLVCLMNSKGNQIPGKLYHYAGSYHEILLIKDGEYGREIQEFFEQFRRYSFVDNRVEDIKEQLVRYKNKGIPERIPLADFDSKKIASSLINPIPRGAENA